jgi:hypothetical protein
MSAAAAMAPAVSGRWEGRRPAYGEIPQGVRVAQTGVRILSAFLPTLAFHVPVQLDSPGQRDIYTTALMLSAAATAADRRTSTAENLPARVRSRRR